MLFDMILAIAGGCVKILHGKEFRPVESQGYMRIVPGSVFAVLILIVLR
jgi:hypothetical protein